MRGLDKMSVDQLLELSAAVGKMLERRRREILHNLDALKGTGANGKHHRRAGSVMKGRKIAPKYRGPGGETWAGRGAKPRWMTALLKTGRKVESFRIKGT